MKELNYVKVTTLVDNDVWMEGLESSWALSFHVEGVIEGRSHFILMDVGGSLPILIGNASKLGVDLSNVEAIFISHWHGDHCGSLDHVLPTLGKPTPVYVPSRSLLGSRRIARAGGVLRVCSEPLEFIDGMMSTGLIGGWISEHSLLLNVANKGLVILTGCAHPGIINIVKRAIDVSGIERVWAVMGGFHISSFDEGVKVGRFLRELDVKLVSPCHCTGGGARRGIAEILGERYVRNGSGKIIEIVS